MVSGKKQKAFIHYLPIYGCISTGLIYVAIGSIAILSFFKLREGGADESSMLAVLNDFLIGRLFVWIILVGTLCYISWRMYETITDPYQYGNNYKGIFKRTGIALSTIADALIVYAAIKVLVGAGNIQLDGQPEEERAAVEAILQKGLSYLVILMGLIVILTAIVQFLYGVTRGYKERIDIDRFSSNTKLIIHSVAWTGYFARGIILGITGFFLLKSGILRDAQHVVNTDKAFDFIGDHIGHFYFIVVAIGTLCYGIFMIILGVVYDTDID